MNVTRSEPIATGFIVCLFVQTFGYLIGRDIVGTFVVSVLCMLVVIGIGFAARAAVETS